ncbi:MAG: hypothetical protein H7Z11_18975 [Verrucomicrobia bacterium]|nr:hypothetical protein [Leptolyngbya sp. ES-bin-22]
MAKTTVSVDDLVTVIPQKVLDFLQLKTGDRIDFIMEENGKVVIQLSNGSEAEEDEEDYEEDPDVTARMTALRSRLDRGETIDIRDLAGILHRKGMKPVSVEEMDEGIKDYMRKKFS